MKKAGLVLLLPVFWLVTAILVPIAFVTRAVRRRRRGVYRR